MLFGFDDKREFIPQIYHYLNNQELMLTFLTQYNASVDSDLKIPLLYAKNAKAVAQKETMVIALGDKNKPAIYVFSDPECPYCREHLAQIDNELKNYQVNYILTPVHGKSAFEKSALIYKEAKKAKNDKEKIAILNKYYDANIKNYPKVSDAELKEVFSLYEKYRSLGLSATPTIIK